MIELIVTDAPEPADRDAIVDGLNRYNRAEAAARARGCIGIWLNTFSFQARGFYEKLGFTPIGQIDDYPVGHQRFSLQKRL
jgi:GNAT superfamily N-acetyltransferase